MKTMNTLKIQMIRQPFNYMTFICDVRRLQRLQTCLPISNYYAATLDDLDIFTNELIQRHNNKVRNSISDISKFSIQHFTEPKNQIDVTKMTQKDLESDLLELMSKNKDKQVEQIVQECHKTRTFISDIALKKLFRAYSSAGKTDMVISLQKYCAKVDPYLHKRNGEFLHYLAKAQCMKGNSENGLSILRSCYRKYETMRSFYRAIFRELIQDSVLNRSEASLVIFKKYVLEFSNTWNDNYPLVCYWHICWSSTWFSDQMLSDELLETSESLRAIVKDRATALAITILRDDYNDDAVTRLLQALLKYEMMIEYAKVLQVLFNYKLKNKDIRGCAEIIRNCEVLGVSLPSFQQGRYIQMLIEGKKKDTKQPPTKDFKLKF